MPGPDSHGAVVDGGLHPPTAADLEHTDVVVLYKGDAGYMTEDTKAALNDYVKRGGGLVTFHDSLCGPDPEYFASLVGGGKKHDQTNFTLDAEIPYTVVDKANPIVKDMTVMTISDEAFFLMTWSKDPPIHLLVNAVIAATPSAGAHKGEVVPQLWTYEHTVPGGSLRARPYGCRDTRIATSRTRYFRRLCCAEFPGRRKSLSMNWWITSRRLVPHAAAAKAIRGVAAQAAAVTKADWRHKI